MAQSVHSWKRNNKTSSVLEDDPRLSRAEAAQYLGVDPCTLAVWASTGRYELPYFKAGKKCIYKKSDLDAFIARNMRGHAA